VICYTGHLEVVKCERFRWAENEDRWTVVVNGILVGKRIVKRCL
jgi:hypothetical protein